MFQGTLSLVTYIVSKHFEVFFRMVNPLEAGPGAISAEESSSFVASYLYNSRMANIIHKQTGSRSVAAGYDAPFAVHFKCMRTHSLMQLTTFRGLLVC